MMVFMWGYLIFFDICGFGCGNIFRIKEEHGYYKIQTRRFYSPIWRDCGRGDIMGMSHHSFIFNTYKDALTKAKKLKAEGIL